MLKRIIYVCESIYMYICKHPNAHNFQTLSEDSEMAGLFFELLLHYNFGLGSSVILHHII